MHIAPATDGGRLCFYGESTMQYEFEILSVTQHNLFCSSSIERCITERNVVLHQTETSIQTLDDISQLIRKTGDKLPDVKRKILSLLKAFTGREAIAMKLVTLIETETRGSCRSYSIFRTEVQIAN